ncbi:hypothetical protein [Actinacidiphila sp. ITFR-21]|uniref:hypothetical protein n=1 Tax=Actinacidiphila sp. ITFR-21 TaxID=3075199 RepID=UPI00288AA1D1|nr:hypothetical protein [Streptomyces sp. ITFR-21]WNI17681.1 hypothetical protein RLT57_20540 [Streptomyces sp. ITFR-21]WNI17821.1 hypothetical protein RLT57_21255 [Streptomyces sp. ITFR-21]
MASRLRRAPYIHTWTEEDGTRRQLKIHWTRDGRTVQWDPRFLGDPEPWFDGNHELKDPAGYVGDDELVTLGDPNDPEFGLVDPDFETDY